MANLIPYSEEYIESLQEAEEFDMDAVQAFTEAYHNTLRFAKNARNTIRDANSNVNKTMSLSRYTKSSVNTYLENPETNEKQLRDLSRYLYNTSSQYRRLLQYFSQMLIWSYIMYPMNVDVATADPETIRKAYLKALKSMSVINAAHEFGKAMEISFKEGVFYGFINETKDSFQFLPLDPDYCRINAVEDGCYTYQFDLSYFDMYTDELELYPTDFQTAYNSYKAGSDTVLRWHEFDTKKTACFKADESLNFPIPPFVSLFSPLADIEDYKSISKDASESSNYKVVYLKMPVDEKGHLKVPKPLCMQAYNSLLSILPDGVGAFLTPLDVDFVNFKQNTVLQDTTLVVEAENTYWRAAGVNALMFGAGDDPSSYALETSIHSDESVCFRFLRQVERWCNRRLKQISGTQKFAVQFLDVTRYNYKQMNELYMKMGQYGRPVRQAIDATLSFTPDMTAGLAYLENTVLTMFENEIPMQSSNTMSGDDEGGRPTNESKGEGLSEAGEQTADSGGNQNRVTE
ncbi:MAG: hypothetical protein J6S14_17330 [Clostridia bacterium]|nr:hypothetical protein [Clostridia bacterium]